MRSLVIVSVLGASLLNTSTSMLPQVEVSNIQPTNIHSAQKTIDISNSYDFDQTKGLASVKDDLKNFKAQEEARHQKELEEAEKKVAQEKAKQEQKERENQAKLAEQRKATAAAAAQTVKIQANPSVSIPSSGIRNEAYNFIKSLGYSDGDWSQIDFIVNKESTWNPNAVNRVSGACGLAQALPCNNSKFGVHTDYKTNWQSQLKWLLDYSNNRYGSISSAYNFWKNNGWY